jgi:hypothetical protein
LLPVVGSTPNSTPINIPGNLRKPLKSPIIIGIHQLSSVIPAPEKYL